MSRPSSISSYGGTIPSTGSSCFLDLDLARQRLERTESRRSRTHEQLSALAKLRASTPNMSPAEINFKDRQIYELQCQLTAMEQEVIECKSQLQTAETTILQQKMTIRNQSKAIENPRSGRDDPFTPSRQNHSYGQSSSSQHFNAQAPLPPPPPYFEQSGQQRRDGQPWRPTHGTTPSAQSVPAFAPPVNGWAQAFGSNSTGHTPEPFASTDLGMYGASTNGSPERMRQSQPPWQPTTGPKFFNPMAMQPKTFQDFQSPQSATSSNPYPESSIPRMLNASTAANNADADGMLQTKDMFRNVFDMTLNYARTHANFPSTALDNALPQFLKEKLMEAATPNSAFGLMTASNTRYLLVSRLMLQWTVKHIFKHDKQDTFAGLDPHADRTIQDFKDMIFDTTAPHLRFTYLNTVANSSKTIRDHPSFPAFVAHLSAHRARLLWARICPMMHQKTPNAEDDLLSLTRAAHQLAERLHTSTDEFRFDFLNVGTPFDASAMINIDPELVEGSSPQQLQAARYTVRLGISPVVSSRENTPQGPVGEAVIAKALVLLRAPRR